MRMKAVVATRRGGPEVLQVAELERPEPRRGEVSIAVRAAGVNASDRVVRLTPFIPVLRLMRGAAICGLEFSGTVASRGAGVQGLAEGDEVFGALPSARNGGSYAEFLCAAQAWLARKPRNLSFEEAAGLPVGGVTALQMLRDKAQVRRGDRVLVNGASGAVGAAAVQIARELGCEVTGVCSTGNVELVRSLGASRVVDYTRERLDSAGPFEFVFDAVGSLDAVAARRLLADRGCYVTTTPVLRGFATVGRLRAGGVRAFVAMAKPVAADLDWLRALAEAGRLRVQIDRVLPLEQAAAAQEHLERGHPRGRVILKIG